MNANHIQSILTDLCKSFKNKIDDQYQLVAQFNITDLEQSWAVIIQPGKKMSLQNGPHEQAIYFFRAEAETLRKIYHLPLGLFGGGAQVGRHHDLGVPDQLSVLRRLLGENIQRHTAQLP